MKSPLWKIKFNLSKYTPVWIVCKKMIFVTRDSPIDSNQGLVIHKCLENCTKLESFKRINELFFQWKKNSLHIGIYELQTTYQVF